MDYRKRSYSQADASELSGTSQEVLRDWRRRNFLQHFGEQGENSRWNYSFDEIIQLAIVRCLSPNGHSLPEQLYMARQMSLAVIAEFEADGFYATFKREITAFQPNLPLSQWMCPNIKSRSDLMDSSAMQLLVFDTRKLVEALPVKLKSLMCENV